MLKEYEVCEHKNQLWSINMKHGHCADCKAQLGEPRVTQQAEPVALQRWGVKWKGQTEPFMEQMPDGYWTPWHIANEALQRATPADDEAVRLLREAYELEHWTLTPKLREAIDAYLAKEGK